MMHAFPPVMYKGGERERERERGREREGGRAGRKKEYVIT